jgi:tripeptide aminopeptidase
MNEKYPRATINVIMKDQYYNMREKIEPDHMFLVDNAKRCMKELGIEPKIQPIRGGTDGATLSYMCIPCPNLCTGGHNYHGRFEYCCLESMEDIVKLLIKLTEEELK